MSFFTAPSGFFSTEPHCTPSRLSTRYALRTLAPAHALFTAYPRACLPSVSRATLASAHSLFMGHPLPCLPSVHGALSCLPTLCSRRFPAYSLFKVHPHPCPPSVHGALPCLPTLYSRCIFSPAHALFTAHLHACPPCVPCTHSVHCALSHLHTSLPESSVL